MATWSPGPLGPFSTAAAFILPSLALVLAIADVRFSGLHVIQSLFYGIAPAPGIQFQTPL